MPLTSASLVGVRQEEAGAASGLVNVMQQIGGALGLAVLVSVFGTAAPGAAAQSVLASARGFVIGADHAFIAATLFVGATVLVLGRDPRAARSRPRRGRGRACLGARDRSSRYRDAGVVIPPMKIVDR